MRPLGDGVCVCAESTLCVGGAVLYCPQIQASSAGLGTCPHGKGHVHLVFKLWKLMGIFGDYACTKLVVIINSKFI